MKASAFTNCEYFDCVLPESWQGTWSELKQIKESLKFGSTLDGLYGAVRRSSAIELTAKNFLSKGQCSLRHGDLYLFHDRLEKCHRCLRIVQKHLNVIQYRESEKKFVKLFLIKNLFKF